jgi:hypothetical protein
LPLRFAFPVCRLIGWRRQPPALRHPYTAQPMDWDAATQSLLFTGRQPQNQNPEPKNIYRLRLGAT